MENSKDSEILEKLYDAYDVAKRSGEKTSLYTCKGIITFEAFGGAIVVSINKKSTPNEALSNILKLLNEDCSVKTSQEKLIAIRKIAESAIKIVK